ncbi:hypothetical protein MJO29_007121 [Puccinia striiformis f. sp. tritici]|uniref:Secreted protein n=1 Tax=Puccinia striiformis f. sp. tritici PST-78 TaxID=1165861 RepID=A0A0L0UZN3_9BASI|nr:hypothetical protein Pst134EA_013252 [Puccinia striiformis f. sp. tritici]KAI9625465.1 hypothetical protein H4Q26_016263 [Puccinia striiformis f. sp. tritici PST-130]KNE92487.1 hypothetical protein PSTG_14087 [Puccinia striiformis f. sp. tritici PST-78]KAH9454158.1 hypothetical protein Pst134EB_014253 [Puccinia striiformis f. sp. tritici]KAH9465366.1 hypothetical protein Pst134EA_013252 [Puccinia striiformis f. sp. tritici]KAI7955722.1 hypothetical protein MJO29_007121 [Puccinia striiformis
MFSSTLSTLIVLSMSYNQIVLGQSTNTSSTGSSAAGSSSGGTSSALGLAAGLSPGCQAAAGGLLTSEFGTCSNIMGLVSVIGASGSIIAPLTTWISGVCTAAPCSSDTLKQASQSVNNGCSSDIQKGSGIAMALQMIVGNYNGAKDLLCTQYTSNSTFCIPSILGNVESASGQNITISQVTSILSGSMTPASQALANVPSGTYCTDCGHALVTQSAAFMASSGASSSNSTSATSSISNTCGASFNDGKIPSSVRVASKTAATGAQNAAGRQVGSILLVAPIALVTFSLSLLA